MKRNKNVIAIPPGATIEELIIDQGISRKELADRMDMSEHDICELIKGDSRLTPGVADKLEKVLGVPARFWNNLEDIYMENLYLMAEKGGDF